MAGGLAGFKSQVAVRGLPLRLSKEEATLALGRGWAVSAPAPPAVARLRVVAAEDGGGGAGANGGGQAAAGSKRPREPEAHACAHGGGGGYGDEDEGAYADYYAEYYGADGGGGGAAAAPGAAEGDDEEDDEEEEDDDDDDVDGGAPRPWADAVANGAHMDLPTTAADAEAVNGARRRAGLAAAADEGPRPPWPYPSTPYERLRAAVFADLHDQG